MQTGFYVRLICINVIVVLIQLYRVKWPLVDVQRSPGLVFCLHICNFSCGFYSHIGFFCKFWLMFGFLTDKKRCQVLKFDGLSLALQYAMEICTAQSFFSGKLILLMFIGHLYFANVLFNNHKLSYIRGKIRLNLAITSKKIKDHSFKSDLNVNPKKSSGHRVNNYFDILKKTT